jgi:hypothetical protein
MSKKLFLTSFMIISMCFAAKAQFSEEIVQAAKIYAQAHLNEDYELLLDYTYPTVIEQAGGREAYKKVLQQVNELQKTRGMRLAQFEIHDPLEQVKVGKEYHVIVPYRSITKVKGGKLTADNTLIAVATESKSKWYFIETTSLTERNLVKVLPAWNNTLELPMKKAPIYKED